MTTSQIAESAEHLELEKEVSSLVSSAFVLERQLALCCALVNRHESNRDAGSSCRDFLIESIGWVERICGAAQAAIRTGVPLADTIDQLR